MDDLIIERRDSVLWLTIDRPQRRNALTDALVAAMEAAILSAGEQDVRAIVLTGTGDRAFCAGADLQDNSGPFGTDAAPARSPLARLFVAARDCPVPLVARVNGAAVAGGMGLLAMCDLAVAADHATFGLPEVKVGLFPFQVLCVLDGLVSRRTLTELALTGEPIDARQAQEVGLVNRVVAAADLDEALRTLLARLVDNSPTAIRRGKRAMRLVERLAFAEALGAMQDEFAALAATDDAIEGRAAFRDKRAPRWTGR
ncbi:enoyl-CoA hydratase-related protein [uncultured Alsobacter sp.]|uniref:enoyl-CoA hydratase-related protein n=1 Tax=uncultured Alsobacter sp. TaxID=1748258 RepID=UPI0025FB6616|nr:enoyl-CoA hydratase-related protein [uncultured Alsobacter sp.]